MENAGNGGMPLAEKESPIKVSSEFNSTDLDSDDNINSSLPNSSDFDCTLDSTVADHREEDEDVSFWVDEEEHQYEKHAVLNEAVRHITDGRVSPLASTLNWNWESISSTQSPTIYGNCVKLLLLC